MIRDWWFRIRHRPSRRENLAFVQGLAVGSKLCPDDEDIARIREFLKESY